MQDLLGMSGGEQALPHPLWCPHTSSTLPRGDSHQAAFFFFFSTLCFFHYTKYWASSCVDVDLSPRFICILEQMLEVLVERHAAKGFMMVGHRAVQLGEFWQTLAGGPPVPAPP